MIGKNSARHVNRLPLTSQRSTRPFTRQVALANSTVVQMETRETNDTLNVTLFRIVTSSCSQHQSLTYPRILLLFLTNVDAMSIADIVATSIECDLI